MIRWAIVRIVCALAALYGVLFGPWWIAVAAVFASSLFFRAWEMLFIALLADFLWLSQAGWRSVPLFTLGAIAIMWALEPLRREFLR